MPHGHIYICMHVLLPTTGILRISLSFVVDPGPLHEIAVSAFLRSPFGRADTISFLNLPSSTPGTSVYISKHLLLLFQLSS